MEIRAPDLRLTPRERWKLLRNATVLVLYDGLVLAALAFAWVKLSPGVVLGVATALLGIMAAAVSAYVVLYVRDLVGGEVEVYTGAVAAKEAVGAGDELTRYVVRIGTGEHPLGFRAYRAIAPGDVVRIRKAPRTRVVVDVVPVRRADPARWALPPPPE